MSLALAVLLAIVITASALHYLYTALVSSHLTRIPGPKAFTLTKLFLAREDYRGTRTRTLNALHKQYGPVVRIGPNEVSFNSTSALRAIYGAGSGFERTDFYHMFEAYGRKNMFSFAGVKEHGDRKKMFAHAYAKSVMLRGENAAMIEAKVKLFGDLLEREGRESEIFSTLHYFALDNITQFLYGRFGSTACLEGVREHRALISDIVDIARRTLSWYTVHFPGFTQWLYSRTGVMACVARRFYPMSEPTTYTGIRLHAMKACQAFGKAPPSDRDSESALIAKLWKYHRSQKEDGIDGLDIAAECADHLLAGIDTTSDTLMFLIWSLSRPQHRHFQERLIQEVRAITEDGLNADGIPRVEASDKLPYVDAVIKETLRLYAPLPGSEPRSLPKPTTIDGFVIPARTVVSISPYALHRNPDIFHDPSAFNPERWLDTQASPEMKKWFWAFSSGGRMCIGMQ